MGEALAVNTTLTQLDLCDNALGEEGGRAMGEALAVNTTLTQLDLCGNKIGSTGASAISQALEVNKALTNLDLRIIASEAREQERWQRPCKSTTSSPRCV